MEFERFPDLKDAQRETLDAWLDTDDSMDCIDSVDSTGRSALLIAICAGQQQIAVLRADIVRPPHPTLCCAASIAAPVLALPTRHASGAP